MKNKVSLLHSALLIIVFIFTIPLQAEATDYYVDKDHPSASDSNPGTEALPWETITKANQTLTAGDTVYIKAGTYIAGTNNYIAPANSGTATSRITYTNYNDGEVIISNQAYGIHLQDKDYITITGSDAQHLIFTNIDRYAVLDTASGGSSPDGSDYNIIAYADFGPPRNSVDWRGFSIREGSNYNWIHHIEAYNYGSCTGGSDYSAVFEISYSDTFDGGDNWTANYNLIEDSTFYHGGHHVAGLHGMYNVFRNNYLYNDDWGANDGNRTLYMAGNSGYSGYNLIENNRFGYAADPCDALGVAGANLSSTYNILRYNSYYHHNLAGLEFGSYSNNDSSYNLVYNNTFFNNAYNPNQGEYCRPTGGYCGAMLFADWTSSETKYNKIKNNLYYSHTYDSNYPHGVWGGGASLNDQTFANNYDGDVSGNPLFVNASTTPPADKTDSSVPDLNLQSSSPAINQGGALTTVSSGCSGSTSQIVLADASYFQDGTWGVSSEVDADWIAVGTISNVVQILSISNNVVDLASPISCGNGDEVWLYKDSDGTQVLYGSAPDAGAYEFSQGAGPSPPKNLRIVE